MTGAPHSSKTSRVQREFTTISWAAKIIIALTHGTADSAPQVCAAARVYDAATTAMFVRSREEVLALVRGLDLVAPGLVWTPEWRPEPGEQLLARPSDCYYYALVARKP